MSEIWIQTSAPDQYWQDIASSSNGTKLAACGRSGGTAASAPRRRPHNPRGRWRTRPSLPRLHFPRPPPRRPPQLRACSA